MAARDDVLEYARELLDLDAFDDYGPMGLQVVGADEVTKVAAAVSSSLELFERAAQLDAQLVIVHHGLLWNADPRVIDRPMQRRLKALFEADITLAAYHLALDAHPELGNNILLAEKLGVREPTRVLELGYGGRLDQPLGLEELARGSKRRPGANRSYSTAARSRSSGSP